MDKRIESAVEIIRLMVGGEMTEKTAEIFLKKILKEIPEDYFKEIKNNA